MEFLTKEHILDLDDEQFLKWAKKVCKIPVTLKLVPYLRQSVKKSYNIKIIDKNEINEIFDIKPSQHIIFQNFHLRFYQGEENKKSKLWYDIIDSNIKEDIGFLCKRKLDVGYLNDELEKTVMHNGYVITISHFNENNIETIDAFTLAYQNTDNTLYISSTCARTYSNLNPSFGLLLRYILINYAKSIGIKHIYNTPVKDMDLFNYYSFWGFRFGNFSCGEIDNMTIEHTKAIENSTLKEFYEKYYNFNIPKGKDYDMKLCDIDTNVNLQKMRKFLEEKLTKLWTKLLTIDFSKSYLEESLGIIDTSNGNFDKPITEIKNIDFNKLNEKEQHLLIVRALDKSPISLSLIPDHLKNKYNNYVTYLNEKHHQMWVYGNSYLPPYVWIDLPLEKKEIPLKEPERTYLELKTGFQYSGNTCYMDSLFVVLFNDQRSSYYKNIIKFSDKSIEAEKYDNYKIVCSKNSSINTKEVLREYIKSIRDQLKEDITKLNEGHESATCSMLREKFKLCLKNMSNEPYDISKLYDLITDLFPKIKIIYKENKSERYTTKTSYLTIGQYLDPEDRDFLPEKNPYLVFYNSGYPRLFDLSKTGMINNFYVINKLDFIIDIQSHKYELVGLIILKGLEVGSEKGGVHYVSYFKNTTNAETKAQWYYYNDLFDKDRIKKTNVVNKPLFKGSPEYNGYFFNEVKDNFPAMFFYKRL